MKNVIKKAFSLLLVSVVAVSMFSFITPNRVDAKVELSKDYVYVFFRDLKGVKPGYYTITFLDIDGNPLVGSRRTIEYNSDEHKQKEKIYLPLWTTKIEFEAVTHCRAKGKQIKTTFTAIPDIPCSNVRPERKILTIGIISGRVATKVHTVNRKSREVCAIFNYISETL